MAAYACKKQIFEIPINNKDVLYKIHNYSLSFIFLLSKIPRCQFDTTHQKCIFMATRFNFTMTQIHFCHLKALLNN